jgi:hypothetical protein
MAVNMKITVFWHFMLCSLLIDSTSISEEAAACIFRVEDLKMESLISSEMLAHFNRQRQRIIIFISYSC